MLAANYSREELLQAAFEAGGEPSQRNNYETLQKNRQEVEAVHCRVEKAVGDGGPNGDSHQQTSSTAEQVLDLFDCTGKGELVGNLPRVGRRKANLDQFKPILHNQRAFRGKLGLF